MDSVANIGGMAVYRRLPMTGSIYSSSSSGTLDSYIAHHAGSTSFSNPASPLDKVRKEVRDIWLSCQSMKEFRDEYPKFLVTHENICDCIVVQWVRYYINHQEYHPDTFAIHTPTGWVQKRLLPQFLQTAFSSKEESFLDLSVEKQITIIKRANENLYELADWNKVDGREVDSRSKKIFLDMKVDQVRKTLLSSL